MNSIYVYHNQKAKGCSTHERSEGATKSIYNPLTQWCSYVITVLESMYVGINLSLLIDVPRSIIFEFCYWAVPRGYKTLHMQLLVYYYG